MCKTIGIGKAQIAAIIQISVTLAMLCTGCAVKRPHVWVEELPEERTPPGAYRISAGDRLDISVWGQQQISGQQTVRDDGNISVVLVGDVQVVGLTTVDAAKEITARLEGDIVQNVRVDISLIESAPKYITVLGEINSQGVEELEQGDTLLDIIAKSGGFTEFSHRDQIYILRPESNMQVIRFDYERLTSCPKGGIHFRLRDGDVLIVD